jgi:hypothetical protein
VVEVQVRNENRVDIGVVCCVDSLLAAAKVRDARAQDRVG